MTETIDLREQDGQMVLEAPYDPNMPVKAKAIGGRFDRGRKVWIFDVRDRERVEQLAAEVYGWSPGDDDLPTATVRYTVRHPHDTDEDELRLVGRRIAWRPGRDAPVKLAPNVVVTEGAFPATGGSQKNPRLGSSAGGVVLEIRDLPLTAAQAMVETERAVLVGGEGAEREALQAERGRLVARLAEIDAKLNQEEGEQ